MIIPPIISEDWPARVGANFQLNASIREALDKERQSHCLPCLCFMTMSVDLFLNQSPANNRLWKHS
jgi:hypothetical protein